MSSLAGNLTSFGTQRCSHTLFPCRAAEISPRTPFWNWPAAGKSLALALTSLGFHPALGSTTPFSVFGTGRETCPHHPGGSDPSRPGPLARPGPAPAVTSSPPPCARCPRTHRQLPTVPQPPARRSRAGLALPSPPRGLGSVRGRPGDVRDAGPGGRRFPAGRVRDAGGATRLGVPGCLPEGTCWAASQRRDIPLLLLLCPVGGPPAPGRPDLRGGITGSILPGRSIPPGEGSESKCSLLSLLLLRWRYQVKHFLIYIINYCSPACWTGSKKADDNCVACKTVSPLIIISHLQNYFRGSSVSHT